MTAISLHKYEQVCAQRFSFLGRQTKCAAPGGIHISNVILVMQELYEYYFSTHDLFDHTITREACRSLHRWAVQLLQCQPCLENKHD